MKRPHPPAVRRLGVPLSRVAAYTARFHVPAAVLEGMVAGVFTLNDIVLRKTFGATALMVTLVVMAPPVSQLLAIIWGSLMEGRPKRPFILGFGGFGRLSLLLVFLAATPVGFAVPVVVSITLATAIIPALNSLYQTNYGPLERGRVFGWVMSATALGTITASLSAGALMDMDSRACRFIYPVAGVLGLGAVILFHRIRPRGGVVATGMERRFRAAGRAPQAEILAVASDWLGDVARALRNPLRGSATLFRRDPNFLRFEAAYMIYGLAFMIMQPVIPIFLVDEIRIRYAEAAMARGVIFWGVVSLLSPLFGHLLDRTNAVKVSTAGFGLLILFPLALAFSHSVHAVYGAFALYGIGMAAINIAWTMGPILFAGRRDAATYMGVHVTMVGIRGLIGNPAGLILLKTVGSRWAFGAAAALFLISTVVMTRLDRRMEREREASAAA